VLVTRRSPPVLLAALLAVTLGLAACSQSDDPTSLNPAPKPIDELTWSSADIGAVSIPGRTEVLPDDGIRVTGAGEDIWGYADAFHFAYVPVSGDVTIVGRVESLDDTHQWAKAGLMIRAGLEADAAHALMSLQPNGDAEFIYRSATGGATQGNLVPGVQPPSWVRLERVGNRMTGSLSHDGVNWSDVGSVDVATGAAVYVGVAVTSHNLEVPATGTVTNVRLTRPGAPAPSPTPPPPTPPIGDVYTGDWVCPSAPLAPAYTPTMWVATTGDDGNDGRSPDRPLRTLQAAASRVGPGDVVWVRGGVYSSAVNFGISGTASAPIVFESAPGECAVLDGTGGGEYQRVILEDVSHMVFRNFEVRNSRYEGIFLARATDNEISHVRSYGNVGSGFGMLDSHRNQLRYVISHDNFDPPYGGNADGISFSRGDGNSVEFCMSYRNSDDGVDTWLSTNTFVSHCASFDNGWQGGDGNGFKAGGQGVTTGTVIQHSVAFDNKVNGFDWNTSPGFTFDNNTAFGNGATGFVGSSGTMRNNLAFDNGGTVSGTSAETTNSWNLGIGSPSFVSTVRTVEGFLALAAGSPAIDAGTPVGLPYSGERPDLGAVPYGETLATYLGVRLATAD
jgi:hypothetical protein